jgi:hypothetical protein
MCDSDPSFGALRERRQPSTSRGQRRISRQ